MIFFIRLIFHKTNGNLKNDNKFMHLEKSQKGIVRHVVCYHISDCALKTAENTRRYCTACDTTSALEQWAGRVRLPVRTAEKSAVRLIAI